MGATALTLWKTTSGVNNPALAASRCVRISAQEGLAAYLSHLEWEAVGWNQVPQVLGGVRRALSRLEMVIWGLTAGNMALK